MPAAKSSRRFLVRASLSFFRSMSPCLSSGMAACWAPDWAGAWAEAAATMPAASREMASTFFMGSFSFVSFEALRVRAADTTSHVAGAEAALLQVALVVILGAPEFLGRGDLSDDGPGEAAALFERGLGRA